MELLTKEIFYTICNKDISWKKVYIYEDDSNIIFCVDIVYLFWKKYNIPLVFYPSIPVILIPEEFYQKIPEWEFNFDNSKSTIIQELTDLTVDDWGFEYIGPNDKSQFSLNELKFGSYLCSERRYLEETHCNIKPGKYKLIHSKYPDKFSETVDIVLYKHKTYNFEEYYIGCDRIRDFMTNRQEISKLYNYLYTIIYFKTKSNGNVDKRDH